MNWSQLKKDIAAQSPKSNNSMIANPKDQEKITNLRNSIIYNDKFKYKTGDLVKNLRDQELGFVIGIKPEYSSPGKNSYFVICLRTDTNESGIRYIQERHLELISKGELKKNDLADEVISEMCNYYCLMDCSDCPIKKKYGCRKSNE